MIPVRTVTENATPLVFGSVFAFYAPSINLKASLVSAISVCATSECIIARCWKLYQPANDAELITRLKIKTSSPESNDRSLESQHVITIF